MDWNVPKHHRKRWVQDTEERPGQLQKGEVGKVAQFVLNIRKLKRKGKKKK